MARTPNLTVEEYRAIASSVDGRVSAALKELEIRLEENLPGIIDDQNTIDGFTDEMVIRKPVFYAGAPVGEEDGCINGILMSASIDTNFQGNSHFVNTYTVSIYSIDQRVETKEQYWRHHDRVGLIRRALKPFLSGVINEQNQVCWSSLVPTQVGVEIEDWEQYGGMYAFYRMVCGPAQNTWS